MPQKIIRWSFYVLVGLVPLFFLTITSELFEFPKIILVYFLTAVITTAWACDCVAQKKLVFRRTLLDIPLLIFLSSQVLSFLFSIDQHVSWFGYYSRFNGGLLSLACYSILYWAFVTFMDSKSSLRTLHLALSTATLVSLYGVAQHFGIDSRFWVQDVKNRVFSTLGQPNWLAAYLVALIFIPISFLFPSPRLGEGPRVRYWGNIAISILLFITLLFTKSRSGLLAFGISSIVFWLFYFVKTKSLKLPIILNSIFIILSLLIKNPLRDLVFKPAPSAQPAQVGAALESGGTESGEIRKIVWKGALKIWLDGPKNILVGSGPETFAMAYYAHRPVEHNQTSEWEMLYNKAHNEFLNFLSTTGIVGLGAYLLLLLSMGIQLYKSKNVALLAGWVSLSVTNFWGFSVVTTQILLFLLPAIAQTLTIQPSNHTATGRLQSWRRITVLLIFLAFSTVVLAQTRYLLADVHFASAQKSHQAFSIREEASDILGSYNEYSKAYNLNPNEPTISSDFGVIAAYMSILSADSSATDSANLASLAKTVADQAIAQSPTHPNYYKTKSRTYLVLAALDDKYLETADEALAQAAKLSPTDPRIPYNRSLIAKYSGDKERQKKFLEEAVALRPAFQSALDLLNATPSAKTP